MATPPLFQPVDLVGLPGAPFTETVVKAVAAAIRAEAGWHIAPEITETVTLDAEGGRYLFLPTLHLSNVTAVRDEDGTVLDGWSTAPTARFRAGVLRRRDRAWPRRPVEVDVTHGHEACPDDLLLAAAALCADARVDKATGAVRLGSLSINGAGIEGVDVPGSQVARTIDRYRIPARP